MILVEVTRMRTRTRGLGIEIAVIDHDTPNKHVVLFILYQ